MTDTVLNAPPDDLLDVDRELETELPEPASVLPSERLNRLAELAATALKVAGPAGAGGPVLTERALADVLAAVDASTATATKAAYRSDWNRFTTWTTERGFTPLPAPPLVVAHYVMEAAAEQASVGKWRYTRPR